MNVRHGRPLRHKQLDTDLKQVHQLTTALKQRGLERLRQDVGRLVTSTSGQHLNFAGFVGFPNEVVSNIDMLGSLVMTGICGERNGSAIITPDDEGFSTFWRSSRSNLYGQVPSLHDSARALYSPSHVDRATVACLMDPQGMTEPWYSQTMSVVLRRLSRSPA